MNTLYLFPDTNFFIQCLPFDQIDWSPWKSFDEVQIIVCRPVQREIDNQKNRGGDRVGKRARQTNSLFRELIISGKDKIARDTGPKVLMHIDPSIRPSPALKDQLDYSKPDDEIVGCVHAFRASNPGADARLLTHDSGPMATAKMLGLDFVPVPDEWLSPPESNDEERERRRIETELTRLKKAEPEFHISYLDQDGREVESIALNHVVYESLKPDELSALTDALKNHFPIATEFGRPDKPDSPPPGLSIARMPEYYSPKYAPPPDDEIESYKQKQYPDWVERCTKILQGLHHALNDQAGQPLFRIAVTNDGIRPGKDVLVSIAAHGNFKIRPPEYRNDDDERKAVEELKKLLTLPSPPNPPRGKWTRGFPGFPSSTLDMIDQMKAVQAMISPYGGLGRPFLLPPLASGRQRDPNAFYYKEDRPRLPVQSFSLECEQWRHGLDQESFLGEIFLSDGATEVRGALECTIHAENFSSLIRKTIPVRISVTTASTHERAQDLVHKLITHSG